jgi:small ligand-binding sensory domain FIST
MKWSSTVQISDSFSHGLRAAVEKIKPEFQNQPADLALLFVSWKFRQEIVDLWPLLRKEVPAKTVIGCTAGGVIGGGEEIEDRPAVSLTCAYLPNVNVRPFGVKQETMPGSDGSPKPWRDLVQSIPEQKPQFLLLSDPFSLDSDLLVGGLDFAFPDSVKVGGLASGGQGPRENLLILSEKVFYKGAVGVALSGDIKVDTVVAQGCRPIGKPLTITSCNENVLYSVDNQPPLKYLSDLYEHLSESDRELLRTSLFLGLVMDPFQEKPKQGDFLIRNIVGLDQEQGLLAIGAQLRPGQTVQFHLRDANTSRDDLKTLLSRPSAAKLKELSVSHPQQSGAVLFSCLGRGQRLYGKPDHDSALLRSMVGEIPVGGFFCNGEIGPVGGKTYLHGYTSSIALFSPSSPLTQESVSRSSFQTPA